MLVQAVKEDDFVFLDDNLTAYIMKRHERIGESKSEERLLENALNRNARQCMTTLFNPPYNVKYRCFRDLFQAFSEDDLWKVDRVLPQIPKRFNNLRYHNDDCSLSTLLLRPLDVLCGLENSILVQEITRPKRRAERNPPMVELCNMFFEVMFSTPALFSKLNALKHEDIKSWHLLAPEEIKWLTHLSECIGFPQCLLQPDCFVTQRTDLSSVFSLWTAHRFKSVGAVTDSASIDPPSLLVCCRVRIRIHLITLQERRPECPNYWELVSQLPLPQKLRDFLLFKELWPSGPPRYYSSDDDSDFSGGFTSEEMEEFFDDNDSDIYD
ncbi:SOCS box [Opisthorchis viverrini]|uniref:SOCS box n=1 Tax=Opisthorchis viverrini TaxID=6198 RepID=A0A1S8WP83_OPIVI|nr:SOCS box [Opisthorchis viverrini]